MENLTDEELMQLVSGGDLDKMRYLFDRYHVRIYNFSLRLIKDKDASRDITQDVFYKIIKHRKTYKQTKFSSWMYTIARNLCMDYYQAEKKTQQHLNEIKLVSEQTTTSVKESIGDIELLNKALDQLNITDKTLIIMSRYQGMKYSEIAEITNSTVGAVKTKMHRALHKLKDYYFLNTQ